MTYRTRRRRQGLRTKEQANVTELLEVFREDPEAFGRYQMFHNQTYGHVVHVTFEPLWDMDLAFEPTIRELSNGGR